MRTRTGVRGGRPLVACGAFGRKLSADQPPQPPQKICPFMIPGRLGVSLMRDPPMGDRRWVPARASTRRHFARARRSHEDARGESRARPRPSRVHAASRVCVVAVRPGRPLFARNNIPGRGGFQGLAMTAGATCRKAASRWASAFRDASGALAGETARVARHAHHARAWSRAASGAIGVPSRDLELPGARLGATSAVDRPRRDRRAFAAHSGHVPM